MHISSILLVLIALIGACRGFHLLSTRALRTYNALCMKKSDDIKAVGKSKKTTKDTATKRSASTSVATKTVEPVKEKRVKSTTLSRSSASDDLSELLNELLEKLDIPNGISDSLQDIKSRVSDGNSPDLLNSVIRVYCTHSCPNFGMPWQRTKQEFSTSTGFVIGGNRILTNAHAVEYGSIIQVKKRQSEDKYLAKVIAVGHECDLAILSVEDASFWNEMQPLNFGDIPDLLEDVSVIGYPVGGDSISITSGVVSRIEMQEYAQASAELLAIQIDAAINPGNSGGPVVNSNGDVIGVAFQSLSDDDIENIGYVVPINVINHFLDDVEKHGHYSGVCGVGVKFQGTENEELRKYYNMSSDDTGVIVLAIAPLAPANKVLQKGDVILKIDNIKVANDGTIPFREGKGRFKERVHLSYYFTQKFADETVKFDLLRGGKKISKTVPLWVPTPLVPRVLLQKQAKAADLVSESSIIGGVPSYLVIGGLVLVKLNREYLAAEYNVEHMGEFESWSEDYRILSLSDTAKSKHEEEVVLLSQVIAHTCNIGYETYRNMRLKSLNGITIDNLRQVKQIVDKSNKATKGAPLVFEFSNGQVVVLNSKAAKAAQEQLCQEHMIPSAFSKDLL